MNLEIILCGEVVFDELSHPLVAGQHDIADPAAFLRDVFPTFVFELCLPEETLPAVHILIGRIRPGLIHPLIKSADLHAFRYGGKGPGFNVVLVRIEHRLRITVPDLHRPDEKLFPVRRLRIDVKKELRGIAYLGNGVKGVAPADHREERHRIEIEEERAGQMEEIPHQQIRRPCLL